MDPSQNPASQQAQNDEHTPQNPASQQAPIDVHAEFRRLQPQRPPFLTPSQRRPDLPWDLNTADLLDWSLQEDRRQTWGFVIYRSTYNSDADWAAFLRRLRFHMERVFDYYNGRDALDKFSLTVFEDRSLFDGASTNAIRQHFQQ
jgi:hypothetical protein